MQQLELDGGFRIDDIVVEPLEGMLTHADGEVVRVEPKVMDVFVVLAGQCSRTVARVDLLEAVWPGQVAADELLTRAISELRRGLRDDPRRPKYIRTVPKRGYRLDGAVARLSTSSGAMSEPRAGRWRGAHLPAFALSAVAALAIAYFVLEVGSTRPQAVGGPGELEPPSTRLWSAGRPTPLTSGEGHEWGPALSPDGNYAAFVSSPPGKFTEGTIFVVEVGSAMPVPLTTDAAASNKMPTWSPDGTRIAFARTREDGRTEIVVKPVLGGYETRLTIVDKLWGHDWSPAGGHLAIAIEEADTEHARIHLLSVNDGSQTEITTPPEHASDYEPRFSPDGRTLAFLRADNDRPGAYLCLQALEDSSVNCITSAEKRWPVRDFDWAPNGGSLIVSANRLLRVPVDGGPVVELPFGEDAYNVAVASHGNRLVYERFSQDSNLWRVPGPAAAVRGEPQRLIASTRAELLPRYSPDGSQIAFVSGRTGSWEVWVADVDGSRARRLTDWGFAAFPDWSPDGRSIAFSSGRYAVGRGELDAGDVGMDPEEAFLVAASGGVPRMISDGESGAKAPSWSADGRYVYFTRGKNDCGSGELWRRRMDSGEEERLTACAWRPRAGVDGRVYYYDVQAPGISSVLANGEEARLELASPASCRRLTSAWTVWQSKLIYVDCQDLAIRMVDLETEDASVLAEPFGEQHLFEHLSLDVSPDGQWLLFSRIDGTGSDLILIEPFQ